MQPICDEFFKESDEAARVSSAQLNANVGAYLEAVRSHLHGLHDGGIASRRVNEEHTDLMDRLVRKLFRLAEDRYFEDFPRLDFRLAVVAVGGYGRRELSLGSDLDLLFLHRGKLNSYIEIVAEAITHRLWDARLRVGVATRTLKECLRVGRADVPTLTSYFDARFLIGDPELFAEFESTVHDEVRAGADDFVQAKLEEQERRHERSHESLYLLQPDVRESVGGLRDYHTARWIAQSVRWEVRRIEHLHVHGFIDGDEIEELRLALDFMWRLRNELHRGGRKNDQLHFQAQERMAKHLGFRAEADLLPVELLMRAYYTHARVISRVSRQAVDHARAMLARRRRQPEPPTYPVEEDFAIAGSRLEIPCAEALRERPVRMLAAFAVAQHHDVELSSRAQRLLRQGISLIDDVLRADAEASALFLQLLSSPIRVYRSLRLMNEIGILGAYIPEFAGLVGLWQQDLYHTYTVDAHSLFLVEQLRRLKKERFTGELALPAALMREVRSPVVLFLACILHDLGKGQGGGHSEKGTRQAPAVCARLGLQPDDTETVLFLVRHHQTMSAMAEERDVHDPRQIGRLVDLAKTRDRLRALYLLTVADIRSVSPKAWTRWKGGLLQALYRNAADWLEASEGGAEVGRLFLERGLKRAAETQEQAVEALACDGIARSRSQEFLARMPRRYLFDHSPTEIAAHVRAALSFTDSDATIAVRSFAADGEHAVFWGLLVMGRNQKGLFSTVSGVLSSFGHDILAAQVYTSRDQLALELYQVEPIGGGEEEAAVECERIEARLGEVLAGRRDLGTVIARRLSEALPAVRAVPPAVTISNEESDFYTVIDVVTNDRPALLYDMTQTLSDLGLDVTMSRASTRTGRITDSFSVTADGQKLSDPERLQEVEEALLDAIRREPR